MKKKSDAVPGGKSATGRGEKEIHILGGMSSRRRGCGNRSQRKNPRCLGRRGRASERGKGPKRKKKAGALIRSQQKRKKDYDDNPGLGWNFAGANPPFARRPGETKLAAKCCRKKLRNRRRPSIQQAIWPKKKKGGFMKEKDRQLPR